MKLFKVTFSKDMRTKMFQCHIKDYTAGEVVHGVNENPMLAFHAAESQLSTQLWYIEARDPADWEPDDE